MAAAPAHAQAALPCRRSHQCKAAAPCCIHVWAHACVLAARHLSLLGAAAAQDRRMSSTATSRHQHYSRALDAKDPQGLLLIAPPIATRCRQVPCQNDPPGHRLTQNCAGIPVVAHGHTQWICSPCSASTRTLSRRSPAGLPHIWCRCCWRGAWSAQMTSLLTAGRMDATHAPLCRCSCSGAWLAQTVSSSLARPGSRRPATGARGAPPARAAPARAPARMPSTWRTLSPPSCGATGGASATCALRLRSGGACSASLAAHCPVHSRRARGLLASLTKRLTC